jgi:AbrB family looped-hinge helix DNA binding protein
MTVKLKDTPREGVVTRIGKGARVVIPASLRKALSLCPGDPVVLRIEEATLRLIPLRQAIAEAQRRVRQYIPADTALVETLLQERRKEAQRE